MLRLQNEPHKNNCKKVRVVREMSTAIVISASNQKPRGSAATPPSDAEVVVKSHAASLSIIRESAAANHQQKHESCVDSLRFGYSKQTAAAHNNFYKTSTEPAASTLSQIVAREQVYRTYICRDRDLEFSFATEEFFEHGQMLELQLEERDRRRVMERRALASPASGLVELSQVVGLSSPNTADLKEKLRHCQIDETAERSNLTWLWSKSWREELKPKVDAAFLEAHHRETKRVKAQRKHHFLAPSVRGAPELVEFVEQQQLQRQKQATQAATTTKTSSASVFPLFPEIDFSFLFEYETKLRGLIERTAMAELKGAQRALRAFQTEMLRDIAILRTKKAETLKRSYVVGYFFRFHLLLLQDMETAVRMDVLEKEQRQMRDQIDVVENKSWLRAKEKSNWRADRQAAVEMEAARKRRQEEWELRRVHDEQQRNLIRAELEGRVGDGRDEHFARAQLADFYEKHTAQVRARQIASIVEKEAASLTLHWNENFHGQIVVTERAMRRQIAQMESDGRSQLLSLEVRSYIQARRDELFDQETAEAMREIDRHRGQQLTASTLPIKVSAANSSSVGGLGAHQSKFLYPRPPSSSSVPGTTAQDPAFVRRGF